MKFRPGTLATTLLLASGAALAQTPPPPPAGPPPVWSGKAEASYVGTTGNTNVQTVGAGLEIDYKNDPWDGLVKGLFVEGKDHGETTAKKIAGELRGGYHLSPRFELFAQGDYFKDEFSGIEDR